MDEIEVKEKLKKIEEIYQDYLQKIDELKKEQNQIIDEFIQELEKAKMEEIKNKINQNAASS
jgi:hypothetical protein